MPILASQYKKLQAFPAYAKSLILKAEGDELIDVLAEINSVERQLGDLRRLHQAEFENKEEGKEWVVKQTRKCNRTYNTPSLLLKAADALGAKPMRALSLLEERDVIRINWQYKNLKAFISQEGLPIMTVQKEITHGDDADIGEDWVTASTRYEKK